jgi:hypothetical protein
VYKLAGRVETLTHLKGRCRVNDQVLDQLLVTKAVYAEGGSRYIDAALSCARRLKSLLSCRGVCDVMSTDLAHVELPSSCDDGEIRSGPGCWGGVGGVGGTSPSGGCDT